MGPLAVVIDTSGSCDDTLVAQFGGELRGIFDDLSPARLTVLYADSRVAGREVFLPGDFVTLDPVGGGGTDFCPALAELEDEDDPPVAVVYLTDLYGTYPNAEPPFPVLWATTTNPDTLSEYYRPPWGEVVEIR
jgi:predicted metal-dependent peptidase